MILKSNQISALSLIALAMTSSFSANAMYRGDRGSHSSLEEFTNAPHGRPSQPPVYRPMESQPLRELPSTGSRMGGSAFASTAASTAPVWRPEEEAERRQVESERARRQQIREEFERRERENEEKRLASVAAKEAAEGLPRQMHQLAVSPSYHSAASTTSQPTPSLYHPEVAESSLRQSQSAFAFQPAPQSPPPYPVHEHGVRRLEVPEMTPPQGTQYQQHQALYSRGPALPTPLAYASQPPAPAGYGYSTPLPASPYAPHGLTSPAHYGQPQPPMYGGASSQPWHDANFPDDVITGSMGGGAFATSQPSMDVPVLSSSNRFDIYPEFPRYATRATNTGILALKKRRDGSLEVLMGQNNDARGKWRIPLGMESVEKVGQKKGRTVTRLALDTLASETGNVVAIPEAEMSAYQALRDVPRIVVGDTVVFVADMTDMLRRKLNTSDVIQQWRTVPLADLIGAARNRMDSAGGKSLSSTVTAFLHTDEAVAVLEAVLRDPQLAKRGTSRRR